MFINCFLYSKVQKQVNQKLYLCWKQRNVALDDSKMYRYFTVNNKTIKSTVLYKKH